MLGSAVEWFASSRVLIVAGKGGVGKTTVGATVGVAAARTGRDVLLVELEGNSQLGRPFGHRLAYHDTELEHLEGGGRLRARQLTPNAALREYLNVGGLNRLTGPLARSGALDLVTAAAPGLRDLLVLGKIRQLEDRGEADLIVVDAPASGHALAFLLAARGLAPLAPSGPIRHQADLVLELLADGSRCQVVLVTRPEEGPVNEVIETGTALADGVGVRLGPVVVNGCWPPVTGLHQALQAQRRAGGSPTPARQTAQRAARFRLDRIQAQAAQLERLAQDVLRPLVRLPFRFTPSLDRADLHYLADALVDQALVRS